MAKAKALKKFVEPLITKSKTDSTHSRRTCFRHLRSKDAVTELFRDVSVKVADRPGGYTRILKTGFRKGDNAEMCFIELVDYNENMLKDTKKKSSTRKRRGGGKKATVKTSEVTEADTKAEVIEDPKSEKTAENKKEEKSGDVSGKKEASKKGDSEEEGKGE